MPHLSQGKRDPDCKVGLWRIVRAILEIPLFSRIAMNSKINLSDVLPIKRKSKLNSTFGNLSLLKEKLYTTHKPPNAIRTKFANAIPSVVVITFDQKR